MLYVWVFPFANHESSLPINVFKRRAFGYKDHQDSAEQGIRKYISAKFCTTETRKQWARQLRRVFPAEVAICTTFISGWWEGVKKRDGEVEGDPEQGPSWEKKKGGVSRRKMWAMLSNVAHWPSELGPENQALGLVLWDPANQHTWSCRNSEWRTSETGREFLRGRQLRWIFCWRQTAKKSRGMG